MKKARGSERGFGVNKKSNKRVASHSQKASDKAESGNLGLGTQRCRRLRKRTAKSRPSWASLGSFK